MPDEDTEFGAMLPYLLMLAIRCYKN